MSLKRVKVPVLAALITTAAFTSSARAIYDTTSPDAPPPQMSSTGDPVFFVDGIGIRNALFIRESPTTPQPLVRDGMPPFVVDSFFDIFTEISLDGGGSWNPYEIPNAESLLKYVNQGHGAFDTEVLSLNLGGGTLPPGLMIRESPTLQSLGHTTLTQVTASDFTINSFFDVFTELSLDGGQTWSPATAPLHLVDTPEPTSLALLALGSATLLKRRK